MKKIFLIIITFVLTIALSGCLMGRHNYQCSEDDYLVMSFGHTHPAEVSFEGINTGILNQCNLELETEEEILDLLQNPVHDLEFRNVLDPRNIIRNSEHQTIDDKGYLERNDMGSVDFVSYVEFVESLQYDQGLFGFINEYSIMTNNIEEETQKDTVISNINQNDSYFTENYTNRYWNERYWYYGLERFSYNNDTYVEGGKNNELLESKYFVSRASLENDHLTWDKYEHHIYHGKSEELEYTVYDEGNKHIYMNFFATTEDNEINNVWFSFLEIDIMNNQVNRISLNMSGDSIRFRIFELDLDKQRYIDFSSYNTSEGDPTGSIKYGFLNDDELVIELGMPYKRIDNPNCTNIYCAKNSLIYNMKYLEGWEKYKTRVVDEDFEIDWDTENNDRKISVFGLYGLDFGLSNATFYNWGVEYNALAVNSRDTFTQEILQNPLDGLSFSDFDIEDMYSTISEEISLMELEFKIEENIIIFFGNRYQIEGIEEHVIDLFPRYIIDFYKSKSEIN